MPRLQSYFTEKSLLCRMESTEIQSCALILHGKETHDDVTSSKHCYGIVRDVLASKALSAISEARNYRLCRYV
jgi:hypothetical protein